MARFRTALLLVASATACGDESLAPDDRPAPDGGDIMIPDAGPRDAAPVDGGPTPEEGVRLSGRTLRLDGFISGYELVVDDVVVQALGVAGVDPVSSGAVGRYEVRVPENGQVVLRASKPQYLSTYARVPVATRPIERDVLIAYLPHVRQMSTRFGLDAEEEFDCRPPNPGRCQYGILMGQVLGDGGEPAADVGDFVVRVEGDSRWPRRGPYFFTPNGQPDPSATATRRSRAPGGPYQGGFFVVYVEIPRLGEASRAVSVAAGQGRYFGPVQAPVYRGGFTWIDLPETGTPVPPPDDPPPPPPQDADFDAQVYPLFLPVDRGGLGCVGCHTNQDGRTPAAGMNLYGGPAAAFSSLDPARYPQRVNVAQPGRSLLLTKPLYADDGEQDHPIFAFVSTEDPAYRIIYGWIAGGATRDGPNLPPVSFSLDVRPILYGDFASGGAGCAGCHVQGVNAQTAPGGLYFGGSPADLHRALTVDRAQDGGTETYRVNRAEPGRSLLLLKPLAGSPVPHPSKPLVGTQDPRYQTLYRWIVEGAENDSP